MFDSPPFRDPVELPMFGAWTYRRLPDGGLVQAAPTECPRGHQLGPRRATLPWNPGLRRTMVSCNACYDTNPTTAMFLPAEPEWMDRFRELVTAHKQREAMALFDSVLPVPIRPTRQPS